MPYPPTKAKPFEINAATAAVLVVDMQNDFVREGAPLEVPSARDTIAAHQRLIGDARKRNIPTMFSRFLSGPEYTLIWEWSPTNGPETKCCWKGHLRYYPDIDREADGSEIIEELAPEPGDHIIEKFGYSAFFRTNTADLLRALGRDTLIVTGTVTQICVEDTVRGALHEGVRVVVASDAVSSFDDELQRVSLRGIEMKYGRVQTVDEILDEWSTE
ncbi:MAG: isochorismatase family protein [Acidimicrobiia bacterium]|nr:isochorismatase family protein [Acidimicrobiia bacterium]